ncbi:MAG TPA: DUF2076 domain-containing protein [Rhodocyclaceae bacterium]|nr:DUF2076 domain-containing protein [Rhodocyclaceae bacterium]
MISQEREQLVEFLRQLAQVPPVQKDGEADALIREACAKQPDAPYLLVQRALLMEQALQQAQGQIGRLQSELDQARSGARSGGFLDRNAWWGNGAQQQPTFAQPQPPSPSYHPAPATGGWGSGWLGNVATTAAGVVAGSFLFQGIEHLMGGHHGGGNWFGGTDNPLSQGLNETTIVNNYYDSTPDGGGSLDAADFDVPLDDRSDWV